jgi:hypothetical protein
MATTKVIDMNEPATPVPEPKTLAEQKAEFTAEGSPPPGKVSTSLPVGSPDPGKPSPPPAPVPAPARATIRLKRAQTPANR